MFVYFSTDDDVFYAPMVVDTGTNLYSTGPVLRVGVPDGLRHKGGSSNILLQGGSGMMTSVYHTGFNSSGVRETTGESILSSFEYVPSLEALDYDVISGGLPEPAARVDTTINYTTEETVNETVFLVTRTKFPDGTTMIINSVPKP